MAEDKEAFIGVDVAKLRNAVAVADAGRDGEVRFYGEVDASPESMCRLAARLAPVAATAFWSIARRHASRMSRTSCSRSQ